MDEKLLQAMIAMGTATVGLALIAIIVSKNANTTGVISSITSGYAQILQTAISPVAGGSSSSGSMFGS